MASTTDVELGSLKKTPFRFSTIVSRAPPPLKAIAGRPAEFTSKGVIQSPLHREGSEPGSERHRSLPQRQGDSQEGYRGAGHRL